MHARGPYAQNFIWVYVGVARAVQKYGKNSAKTWQFSEKVRKLIFAWFRVLIWRYRKVFFEMRATRNLISTEQRRKMLLHAGKSLKMQVFVVE